MMRALDSDIHGHCYECRRLVVAARDGLVVGWTTGV